MNRELNPNHTESLDEQIINKGFKRKMHNWNHRSKDVKTELDHVNLIQESNFNLELMKIKQDEVPINTLKNYGDKLFPSHYAY